MVLSDALTEAMTASLALQTRLLLLFLPPLPREMGQSTRDERKRGRRETFFLEVGPDDMVATKKRIINTKRKLVFLCVF